MMRKWSELVSKIPALAYCYYMKPHGAKQLSSVSCQNKSWDFLLKSMNNRSCMTEVPCCREKQYFVERLKDRSYISVAGKDATVFLQRLMTNDINLLTSGSRGLYTLFLNLKGMVVHDAIVYAYGNNYLVEVDNTAIQALLIHMKMFKGSFEVEIKNVEDRFSVWTVYLDAEDSTEEDHHILESLEGVFEGSEWYSCMDPRLDELGLRIIGPRNGDISSILRTLRLPLISSVGHQRLRYQLGVAQGLEEIPYGRNRACEVNGDYLNALCHNKENYIGYDETVFKSPTKRVLPLVLPKYSCMNLKAQLPIEDLQGRKKRPIGFLCGWLGKYGIGIISINEALTSEQVRIGRSLADCFRPPWWHKRLHSLGAIKSF